MIFAVLLILIITYVFLIFSSDINTKNERFLKKFGIIINPAPVSFEEIRIPESFDAVYQSYNFLQIEAGFDLSDYKGLDAVRYTYEILNFPDEKKVYANVICRDNKAIGGDIACIEADGYMLPLNFLLTNQ